MMQIIKLDKNLKKLQFWINIFINYKFYLILFSELKDKAYDIFVEFNSNKEFVRLAEAPTYKKLLDNYFKSYIYDEN